MGWLPFPFHWRFAMSKFLIPVGSEISVEGVTYTPDERGVVEVPFEHEELLHKCHGLSLYVEAPAEAPAPKASKAKAAPAPVEAPAE